MDFTVGQIVKVQGGRFGSMPIDAEIIKIGASTVKVRFTGRNDFGEFTATAMARLDGRGAHIIETE